MSARGDVILDARGIARAYPGVRALDGVDLEVRSGEVLAVVGENGAGKSTLMRILAGAETPHAGTMRLAGAAYAPRSVLEAIDRGVALIHQELRLAGNLDVAGNIFLGREPRRGWRALGVMDRRAMDAGARRWMSAVGLAGSTRQRLDELPIGHRQLVEIAKALSADARVVIMDEPTSSLALPEVERLFGVVRELVARGVAVVYISHRLGEVEAIADRVVVLRDGRVSGRLDRAELGHEPRETIMRLMVGRDLSAYERSAAAGGAGGAGVLEVARVRTDRHPNATVDLAVRSGEIVGIAGLVGAGRTELLESIFGIRGRRAGRVAVDGRALRSGDVRTAIAAGLALVPEDRQEHGIVHEWSIRANLSLVGLARDARAGWIDRARELETSARVSGRLRIGAGGDRQAAGLLSGGNQQKVVLGKWLAVAPRVLLLDEPTRGVDVGARAEIYRIMEELAAAGTAILFASSDLEEVIGMSDRVLVMRDGWIAGELERAALAEESIMRLATGSARAAGGAA